MDVRTFYNKGKKAAGTVKVTKSVKVRPMKDTQKAQVKQLVKRMIRGQEETRMIGNNIESNVQHNSAIASADCLSILPTISNGDESYEREGDRIFPKSLRVKGVLAIAPGDQTFQKDIYVRVMILSQKNIKTGSQVNAAAVDAGNLLRPNIPGTAQTNFAGWTYDLNFPVNTDLFKVYMDKVIKLTGCADGGVEQLTRTSTRWSYSFKSLPKSLTFDEGNGDWANNFAPFLAIGYAYADGTSPDTVTTRVISSVSSFLSYTDS